MQRPAASAAPRSAQPPLRGDAVLRRLDRALLRVVHAAGRLVPEGLNPLEQAGGVANVCLVVAILSGALLLFWYSSSVHLAYASLEKAGASWLGGLTRSLHRYSSDGCVFFVLIHAARLTLARRIAGPRWLAWVTGWLLFVLLVLVGWLGYWLVWDQRAHRVALGTADLLDALPIFSEPLARSFLSDDGVNSLLFFVVFFLHMLLPAGMGIALWLHVARLSRSRFFPGRTLTLWILGTLCAVSFLFPATSAPPARMAALPQRFTMDWWYLFPLLLTDRLSGGALWALHLIGGLALFSAPWWLRRGGSAGTLRTATTEASRCNACETCFHDCPYLAIRMVPRSDGSTRYATQSEVDPSRCVGCGICSGSCDSAGVGLLDWLPPKAERRRLEGWLEAHTGDPPPVVFLCAEGASAEWRVDSLNGRCDALPGCYVLSVPCLGWVNGYLVDRALDRGAAAVVLAGCGPEGCAYREGFAHTAERMRGRRKPVSKRGEAGDSRIHLLAHGPGEGAALRAAVDAIRRGEAPRARAPVGARAWAGGAVLAALLGGFAWLGSDLPYSAPPSPEAELVVSFKLLGRLQGGMRRLSTEELEALPVHMRPKDGRVPTDRRHADVRLRVRVDGRLLREERYAPGGLWGDKNSVALETIPLASGRHRVEVELSDDPAANEWPYRYEAELEFPRGERRVVLFDREHGFRCP